MKAAGTNENLQIFHWNSVKNLQGERVGGSQVGKRTLHRNPRIALRGTGAEDDFKTRLDGTPVLRAAGDGEHIVDAAQSLGRSSLGLHSRETWLLVRALQLLCNMV